MFRKYIFLMAVHIGFVMFSTSLWAQSDRQCHVVLTVKDKLSDVILGPAAGEPETYSLILTPAQKIPDETACKPYTNIERIFMNDIAQNHQAFQQLKVGDIVEGTVQPHTPSPFAKHLNEMYHHGFQLLSVRKSNEAVASRYYDQGHVYFRYIGIEGLE